MTEMNTAPAFEPASFEDTISGLRANRPSHPLGTVRQNDGYDGQMATAFVPGAALDSDAEVEALAHERSASGVSIAQVENDLAAVEKRLAFIDEQLARTAYDPRVKAEVSILSAHLREAFENERASLAEERSVALATRTAVQARRAREAERSASVTEAEAAEFEWTQGDPRRAQMLKEAKERLEAEQIAAWSLGRRYGYIPRT